MAALEARGAAIAAAAQARLVARVAEEIGAALPELEIETDADGVTLAAPGLGKRMLSDASLRWIGSLLA